MSESLVEETAIHEEHVVPDQLNYRFKNYAGPKYKFSRIVPLSGSQTITIPANSTAEVLMEIPVNVANLSQDRLYANIAMPAQGAGNFTWYHTDGMPLISEIDLMTRSGIYLCQLPNFQKYMRLTRKVFTKRKEFDNTDSVEWLYPSQSAFDAEPAVTPNNGSSLNYVGPAFCHSNAVANTIINLTLDMPLSAIKKSIFAMNKDLVFPDILVFRILFGPGNKFVWLGTSGADPTAGAAPFVGNITISNLTLYHAIERNEDLAQTVRELVNSPDGLNILIDYPTCVANNLTGINQNISIRYNRANGKNLTHVISAPFNATETENTAYDHFNIATPAVAAYNAAGTKVASYYTQLDNVRLQDITLNTAANIADDYRENVKFCKDSVYSDKIIYYHEWFHMDRFYELPICETEPEENLDKGMSLIVERKYDLIATMAGATAINWYTASITQKDLHIGSQMIAYQ